MTTQLPERTAFLPRHGTTAQIKATIGMAGEIVVDIEKNTFVVMDGTMPGGVWMISDAVVSPFMRMLLGLPDAEAVKQLLRIVLKSAAQRSESDFALAAAPAAAVTAHEAASDPHPQYLTVAEANAFLQQLDADLTAIAALATQPFGRSVLTAADAPAARAIIGLPIGFGPDQFMPNWASLKS